MKKLLLVALVLMGTATFAQVGIGTASPSKSAMLDIVGTNKGVLIPRVTLTGTSDIATIAAYSATLGYTEGLMVYNTATASDVVAGFYYWSGTTVALGGKWNRSSTDVANSVISKSSAYTAASTDETILVTAATADVVITLPVASTAKGKKYNIKKVDASIYNVSIVTAGTTTSLNAIEGVIGTTGIYGSVTLQGWSLQSDGTNWYVISRI